MKFNRFDPAPCAFPAPRLAPLPDRPDFTLRQTPAAAPKASDRVRHYARGRYALAAAYRLAGVGRDSALLAPAYHCVTMLDPALALGAQVVLYPLRADLSINLECLDALLATTTTPVKALLATHFFGVPQDFSCLRAWCEARGIVLVEDCSHVLCTVTYQAAATGMYGRYVVASPYKFFACEDGGLLYSPLAPLPGELATRPAGLVAELRAAKRQLERRWQKRPTPSELADTNDIDRQLATWHHAYACEGDDEAVDRAGPSAHYRSEDATRASLRTSRALVAHAPDDLIRKRRENYRTWSQALTDAGHCHALFPKLPDDAVPYMFPLYLDHPSLHFCRLKRLGIPLFRWDEMAVSSCLVAGDYRLHLIHLPCHQSLRASDMAWLTRTVRKVLSTTPAESSP